VFVYKTSHLICYYNFKANVDCQCYLTTRFPKKDSFHLSLNLTHMGWLSGDITGQITLVRIMDGAAFVIPVCIS